jgi:hypothetical protein
VLIQQTLDSDGFVDNCTLRVHLDPPNNVDQHSITGYRVDYPSGSRNISRSGSEDIIVSADDCKEDIRLNVTAIVCNIITGAVASGIKPKLIPPDTGLSPGEL